MSLHATTIEEIEPSKENAKLFFSLSLKINLKKKKNLKAERERRSYRLVSESVSTQRHKVIAITHEALL